MSRTSPIAPHWVYETGYGAAVVSSRAAETVRCTTVLSTWLDTYTRLKPACAELCAEQSRDDFANYSGSPPDSRVSFGSVALPSTMSGW